MSILETEIMVTLSGPNIQHYRNLGYVISENCHGEKILVKVTDLPLSGDTKLTKICDNPFCDIDGGRKTYNVTFMSIQKQKIKYNGINLCKNCASKKAQRIISESIPYSKCLWSTHPEIATLLEVSDLGFVVSSKSARREKFVCPDCNLNVGKKKISDVVKKGGVPCQFCADSISYPEKFINNMLSQLNIEFEQQKNFIWSNGKRYDFFIPSINCIIETHGSQHYVESSRARGKKSLADERRNDEVKRKTATDNGIAEYVVLNCSESEMEFIKNNVIRSKLQDYFDLKNVDWLLCHKNSCRSLVVRVSELHRNGLESTFEISKILKLSQMTIIKYLKRGTQLGLCDFNPKASNINHIKKIGLNNGIPVIAIALDGSFVQEFPSTHEASRILGVQQSNIWKVCNKQRRSTGGYMFMYKDDYERKTM